MLNQKVWRVKEKLYIEGETMQRNEWVMEEEMILEFDILPFIKINGYFYSVLYSTLETQ